MRARALVSYAARVKDAIAAASKGRFTDLSGRVHSLLTLSRGPAHGEIISTAVERILASIDERIRTPGNLRGVLSTMDLGKAALFSCFRRRLKSELAGKALTIKVLNLCLTKYHYIHRSTMLLSKPFGLLVDPCNGCNLACPGCVHSNRARALNLFQWQPGVVARDRLEEFLHRYGPSGIQTLFCNYGEPLLNPETPKLIRRAKNYMMQTSLSTNLSVPRFDAAAYVASGLDYIVLSIDGATQATYEKYRRKGDLGLVFRNLHALVEAKIRSGRRVPVICWQYLVFEHNAHEIEPAIRIARSLGVDAFQVSCPFDVSWDDPEMRAANVQPSTLVFRVRDDSERGDDWIHYDDLDAEAIESEFDSPWVAKLPEDYRDEDRPAGPCAHTCQWLYKDITMDAHGRIFPCAGAPKQDSSAFLFSQFEAERQRDEPFNSRKHVEARRFFASMHRHGGDAANGNDDPYCMNCDWVGNHDRPDIGNQQAEQYLDAVGSGLFSEESRRILCGW